MEARRDGSLDEPPAPIKPTDPADGEREAEREALAADGMEDE
jgi:hypothetical protein